MSEKSRIISLAGKRQPKQPRQKGAFFVLVSFVAAISVIRFFHCHPASSWKQVMDDARSDGTKPFSWEAAKPSRGLQWESCYEGEFECARLDVPMDWQDPTEEKRVAIGVIKYPAKMKGNLPPLFVNPGGPGGSGVSFLRGAAKALQTIVGDNHDVLSFDPRGVGVSTPRIDCWGSSQRKVLWALQQTHVVDERPGLIYDAYAQAVAMTGTCETALNETEILHNMSTPNHARDMLEILNQTGHEKLRYWGFSYGTILGGVFAGLYPDRVERLVSDGNCDYTDWFTVQHTAHMADTDLIFDGFDKTCHQVGPLKCNLWASSPKQVQQRRSNLLESLKKKPVILPAWSTEQGPETPLIVTYSLLQLLTRTFIYNPLIHFPAMASVYAGLERGDALPLFNAAMALAPESSNKLCMAMDVPLTKPLETTMEWDAFAAIMCSDGMLEDDSVESMVEYAETMSELSRWAGAANVIFRVPCAGKTKRAKWTFSTDDIRKDTAFPILYIGNMADNVTPLQSARNNSAYFPSSVVLKQNSYGHCSSASPSKCTAAYIRAYFQDGTLPEDGSECDPDYHLFEYPMASHVQEQSEISRALRTLAEEVDFSGGLLGRLTM